MTAPGPPARGAAPPLPSAIAKQPATRKVRWAPPTRLGQRFGRSTEAALRPLLGDEQITAGARVAPGRAPRLTQVAAAMASSLAGSLAAVRLGIPPDHIVDGIAAVLWPLGAALLTAAPAVIIGFAQRQVLLAATGQRLTCWRLSTFRQRPVSELFTIPLPAAHITGLKAAEHSTVISCDRPGNGPLKLTAIGARRKSELSAVIAAAQRAGAWFEVRPPRRERLTR